jgi:hypothetical protein
MTPSSGWYLQQADVLAARATECSRLAAELEASPLPTLLAYAGDDTWRCPAAAEFRREVLVGQARILDAIERLRADAYGFANDADEMARTAALVAAGEGAA